MSGESPLLLYDGTCGLCDRSVQFLLKVDKQKRFMFAALQSEAASIRLSECGTSLNSLPDSLVLIAGSEVYTRWRAVRKIAAELKGAWYIVAFLGYVMPTPVGNLLYDLVARYRYHFFGKKDYCAFPDAADRSRFLG